MSVMEKFKTMEYGPAPEDPKESLQWLDRHHRRFGHFIGGAWKVPAEGSYFATSDPSTGEKIADVAQGSAADIDAAVKAARKAATWAKTTAHNRAQSLCYLAENLSQRGEEITRRLAAAVGKQKAASTLSTPIR